MTLWLILWMIDISFLKMKLFFLFRNYYSIIPAPWSMTDIMNDRYIHPQNKIIIFYFETITASLQHLDQWLIDIYHFFIPATFKYFSSNIQVSFKYLSSTIKVYINIQFYRLFFQFFPTLSTHQHHSSSAAD